MLYNLKYLITGGAGFIGSSLANSLAKVGHEVTVIDDLSMGDKSNLNYENINFIKGDVCNKKLLKEVFHNHQFDYIYLLAAIASVADSVERPIETHNVNFRSVLDTLELVKISQKNLKRIIFSSSAAVYGDEQTLPKKEESIIRPLTPYAIDKFAAEKYTLVYNNLYDLPTTAVRFFNVYGMNQNPSSVYSGVLSIITNQFKKLLNGEETEFTLFGDGNQSRDFVFIEDVIAALLLVAEKEEARGNVYNVGTGEQTSLNDIIKVYEEISKKKLPVKHLDSRLGDIKKSYADISSLKRLGFKPSYDIYKGIEKYFNYEITK